MKLKLWQKIALSAVLVASIGVGLGGSIAWFDARTHLEPQTSFEGVSEGAYFAYGNGKPRGSGDDEPYGISSPRHLYNLAWLQYLGLIDDVFNQKPATSEAYFELANDIDMTGWTLPPIGTTTNPFMGHFNGNGFKITGLTVSNEESDFSSGSSKKPERASGYSSDIPHIVGLFGVVGPYRGSGLSYSSSTDAITNVNVAGITIKSRVNDGVLAGLVAGYVNGPISSVGVSDAVTESGTIKSTLDLQAANGTSTASKYSAGTNMAGQAFAKISEYGTVGYAESDRVAQAKRTTSSLYGYVSDEDENFTAATQGEAGGFGGSIDMKTMYNGILNVWTTYPSNTDGIAKYPTKREVTYDKNGNVISDQHSDYQDYPSQTTGSGWSYDLYQYEQKSGDKVASSYSFARRTNSNSFLYLYGDKTHTVSNALTKTVLQQTAATVITMSKTIDTNVFYIRYDNGLTYSTLNAQASRLVLDNGKIYYPDNSGNTTVKRYLYKNGKELSVTTSSASASTFAYESASESYYVTESSTKYYLSFDVSQTKWVFDNDRTLTAIHSRTHYLTASSWANGSAVKDTTLSDSPSWNLPANGSSGYIYATVNGTNYYLRGNGTTLTITTRNNERTTWTISSDGTRINSGSTYIAYDSGWKLKYPKYKISDGNGHYLSTSAASSGATLVNRDSANATEWSTTDNETFYVGTNYYLTNTESSPYYSISSSGTKYTLSDNYLTSTYTSGFLGWTTHYLYVRFSNNQWSVYENTNRSTARNNGTVLTVAQSSVPEIEIERNYAYKAPKGTTSTNAGDTYYEKSTSTEDAQFSTKPTYFPLRQEKNGETPNGIPQQTNTGYVISGANDTTGDIRVSKYTTSQTYGKTFINRYGSNGIPIVYSRNDTGDIKIYDTSTGTDLSANYEKFTTTRSSLADVFTSDPGSIYGLHFVGATVSYSGGTGVYAGNSVFAETATINKQTYSDYELPKDCIDFNLKEKGYVNFIAGTYYSGSDDCFFSLHDIGRNGDDSINYIKEITEIYESKSTQQTATEYKTYSYQYKYHDGTYSVPYKFIAGRKVKLDGSDYIENQFMNSLDTTNYSSTPKFKTSWIKQNTLLQSYAYYFEIPINSGEYCLSSVAGADGAYLMYLDIGANAAKMNRTTIAEYIKEITTTWNYPKGLALVATGTTPGNVNAYNSYCVVIDETYGGTVTLSRDSETTGSATYSDTTNKIRIGFYHDDITVTGSPALEEATPASTTTDDIKRITYFDYNTGIGSLYKLVVTKRNNTDATVERFQYNSLTSKWETASAEDAILYDKEGVVVNTISATNGLFTEATMAARFNTIEQTGTVVLKTKTMYYAEGSLTISYALNGAMQQSGNGQFFIVSGYDVDMAYTGPDGSVARVTVLSVVSSYNQLTITLTIHGQTVNAAGDKVTIPISA